MLPNYKAIYHTYVQDENGNVVNETTEQMNYRKFVHPILGYEVVLDAQGNIITDPLNAGTYNFYEPSKPLLHKEFDVNPYMSHGNSSDDPSTKENRSARQKYFWPSLTWEAE